MCVLLMSGTFDAVNPGYAVLRKPFSTTKLSEAVRGLLSDVRVRQYWDKGRLLSKAMGETGRKSVVWDRVIVYDRGVAWSDGAPPRAVVSAGPVVDVIDEFVGGLHQALASNVIGANR